MNRSKRNAREEQTDRKLCDRLRRAVSGGDTQTARRLIKGGVNINATFWYDGTLLHEAVGSNMPEMVKMLLQYKPDINAKNMEGRSALHIAARLGNSDLINLLLDHKADVSAQTDDGRTALHIALWRKHESIACDLIKAGAAVNTQDDEGWTPLHWAASKGLMTALKLMVNYGAKLDIPDKTYKTALHESLIQGQHHVTKQLILYGADVNKRTKQGTTLQLCCKQKVFLEETVSLLVNSGYDITQDTWLSTGKLPPSLQQQTEILMRLKAKQNHIVPLAELCRYRIRRTLNAAHGGRAILKWLDKLPLPGLLKDFVSFKEEIK